MQFYHYYNNLSEHLGCCPKAVELGLIANTPANKAIKPITFMPLDSILSFIDFTVNSSLPNNI